MLIAAISVLPAPTALLIDERSAHYRLIDFVIIVAQNILVYAWCHYDVVERNEPPLGHAWRLLFVLFGIFALIVYLLKSRGWAKGLRAVGITFLLILGIVAASLITFTLAAFILGVAA